MHWQASATGAHLSSCTMCWKEGLADGSCSQQEVISSQNSRSPVNKGVSTPRSPSSEGTSNRLPAMMKLASCNTQAQRGAGKAVVCSCQHLQCRAQHAVPCFLRNKRSHVNSSTCLPVV